MDAVVRNLYQSVQQELEDLRNARCAATTMPKNLSVFSATTKEGIERYELTFPSSEKRKDWERTVMELKRQLMSYNHGIPTPRSKSSSGYGQALNKPRLSLSRSDENVEITGLESKDRSRSENEVHLESSSASGLHHELSAADEARTSSTRKSSGSQLDDDSETLCYVRTQTSNSPINTPPDTPTLREVDEKDDVSADYDPGEKEISEPANLFSQSSHSIGELKDPSKPLSQESATAGIGGGSAANVSEMGTDLDPTAADEQETQASDYSDSSDVSDVDNEVQDETSSSHTTQTTSKESSNEAPMDVCDSPKNNKNMRLLDPHRPTMWLGTEEGTIFIFYANENIKTSRQRQQIKLTSAINSILQLDVRIFVACMNGDLFVYDRNADGLWDVDSPRLLQIDPDHESPVVVRRMLAVAGNVWCAAHRFVYVLNSVTLKVELSFPLNGNPADPRGIQLMAYGKQTVWLATENSPRVSLYHATTGEFLMEIDLKPIVIQSLQRKSVPTSRSCDTYTHTYICKHTHKIILADSQIECFNLLWANKKFDLALKLVARYVTKQLDDQVLIALTQTPAETNHTTEGNCEIFLDEPYLSEMTAHPIILLYPLKTSNTWVH
ncbi:unnamed protein product [Echinostoma caproni]|uniref:Uncharacterized protein n=1 Tax=Echinostoma caproni TaxID=27848 RepID=A0A3P8HE64_9TREM|nr:unnamed protein product [Echinostoma caproni]